MDLDKTWADTFGDRAQKLADKQRDFAMGVKYRVEYTTQDGEKAKSRVYSSKDEADKKEADLVNSGIKQAKVVKVEESVNENIETLLSPEDLKYYRAHRDEIEDILNAEFRSSKLSAKDAVEKHKAMKEGSCGYNTDAKTGKKLNTPGGLEERIKTLVKEFTKQK